MLTTRAYYVPQPQLTQQSWREALALNLGHLGQTSKNTEELEASIYKARSSQYTHVKIPYERTQLPQFNSMLKLVEQQGLKPLIQVDLEKLQMADLINLPYSYEAEVFLPEAKDAWSLLPLLQQHFSRIHYALFVMKANSITEFCQNFSIYAKHVQDLHLYCPFPMKKTPWSYLKCRDIPELKKKLQTYLSIRLHPPLGGNLWDPRVSHHFELEPYYEPIFVNRVPNSNIQVSVVIPTYNNRRYIRMCLEHLCRQNLAPTQFEIVVVDDGSTDGTQDELLRYFQEQTGMNLTLVYFPRVKPRQMGDGQFRAGIARNLGIKHTQGNILSFLDSDILVPPDYLETVMDQLQMVDLLQARRLNLNKTFSAQETVEYVQVQSTDLIPDDPYWEDFNRLKSWENVEHPWKYVCTHSLSIRKETLQQVGGFKNCFIFYGFEDTDFGYRLHQKGYRFQLLDTKVYHLFHKTNRSEFYNSNSIRHQILGQTARIFYRNHLADEIYQILGGYLLLEEGIVPSRELRAQLRHM